MRRVLLIALILLMAGELVSSASPLGELVSSASPLIRSIDEMVEEFAELVELPKVHVDIVDDRKVTNQNYNELVTEVVNATLLMAWPEDSPEGYFELKPISKLSPEELEQLDFSVAGFGECVGFEGVERFVRHRMDRADRVVTLKWKTGTREFETKVVTCDQGWPKYDSLVSFSPVIASVIETSVDESSGISPDVESSVAYASLVLFHPALNTNKTKITTVIHFSNLFGWKLATLKWISSLEVSVPSPVKLGTTVQFEARLDFTYTATGIVFGMAGAVIGENTNAIPGGAKIWAGSPFDSYIDLWQGGDNTFCAEFFHGANAKWTMVVEDNAGGTRTATGGLTFTIGVVAAAYTVSESGPTGKAYMTFLNGTTDRVKVRNAVRNTDKHGIFIGTGGYIHIKGFIKGIVGGGTDLFGFKTEVLYTHTAWDIINTYGYLGFQKLECKVPFKCVP